MVLPASSNKQVSLFWEAGGQVAPDPVDDEPAEWATGVAYVIGDEVTYNGVIYNCLQAHTSQAGWTPADVPALWEVS